MPVGGYFFDSIVRQKPIDEANLNPEDNLEEFAPISDEDLDYYAEQAKLLSGSDRAVVSGVPGTAFGDIALVPAPFLKEAHVNFGMYLAALRCKLLPQRPRRGRRALPVVAVAFDTCEPQPFAGGSAEAWAPRHSMRAVPTGACHSRPVTWTVCVDATPCKCTIYSTPYPPQGA